MGARQPALQTPPPAAPRIRYANQPIVTNEPSNPIPAPAIKVAKQVQPARVYNNPIDALTQITPTIPFPNTGSFYQDSLLLHNRYRQLVGQPPLTWNSNLQQSAQRWANQLASKDEFEHSGYEGVGENLFLMMNGDMSASAAIAAWFKEFPLCNYL